MNWDREVDVGSRAGSCQRAVRPVRRWFASISPGSVPNAAVSKCSCPSQGSTGACSAAPFDAPADQNEAELHVRRSARPRYAMSRSASVSVTKAVAPWLIRRQRRWSRSVWPSVAAAAMQISSIGVGRTYTGTRVLVLIQDLHIRIIQAATGELLRQLTLNPS
jgi:hypothetical protein